MSRVSRLDGFQVGLGLVSRVRIGWTSAGLDWFRGGEGARLLAVLSGDRDKNPIQREEKLLK